MKNLIFIVFVAIIVDSCTNKKAPVVEPTTNPIKVKYAGALKNMIHKGDSSAKANLLDLRQVPNLYALGALENLKGEIQIFDGQPFNTMVDNNQLVTDSSFC